MTKLHLTIKIGKGAEAKLHKIGRVIVDRMRLLLEGYVGTSTNLIDNIQYRVEKNRVVIFTTDPITKFLDEGTKPHIIRPKKPGGALAFKAGNSGIRKNGKPFAFGDTIITKEVKHPGFDPRPFFSQGFFLSKSDIQQILKEE